MPIPSGGDNALPAFPPAGAYAAPADLDGLVDPVPDNVDQLLVRAAREIDRALRTSVYDTENADVIEALRQANVEQVLGNLQDGDQSGLGGVTTTATNFTIGKVQVSKAATASTPVPRTSGLVDQAWLILQTAGLTGGGPGERWACW